MRLEVYSMQFAACKSKWFIFLSEKNKQTALILIQGVKRVNETISFFIAVFNPVECNRYVLYHPRGQGPVYYLYQEQRQSSVDETPSVFTSQYCIPVWINEVELGSIPISGQLPERVHHTYTAASTGSDHTSLGLTLVNLGKTVQDEC